MHGSVVFRRSTTAAFMDGKDPPLNRWSRFDRHIASELNAVGILAARWIGRKCLFGPLVLTSLVCPLYFRSHESKGDIEFAMMNANLMVGDQFDYVPLDVLDQEMSEVADRMKFYGQGKFQSFPL